MKNETTTPSAMYTVNTENSYFDAIKVALGINLRANDVENPYEVKAFDISQTVKGEKINAIFVNISNANFANEDPELTTEFTFECQLSNLIAVDSISQYSALDTMVKDEALLICMYNFTNDTAVLTTYAEALAPMIAQFQTDVATNGSLQIDLNLLSAEPKKTGISKIRRF